MLQSYEASTSTTKPVENTLKNYRAQFQSMSYSSSAPMIECEDTSILISSKPSSIMAPSHGRLGTIDPTNNPISYDPQETSEDSDEWNLTSIMSRRKNNTITSSAPTHNYAKPPLSSSTMPSSSQIKNIVNKMNCVPEYQWNTNDDKKSDISGMEQMNAINNRLDHRHSLISSPSSSLSSLQKDHRCTELQVSSLSSSSSSSLTRSCSSSLSSPMIESDSIESMRTSKITSRCQSQINEQIEEMVNKDNEEKPDNSPKEYENTINLIELVLRKSSGLPASEKYLDFPPYIEFHDIYESKNPQSAQKLIENTSKSLNEQHSLQKDVSLQPKKIIEISNELFDMIFNNEFLSSNNLLYTTKQHGDRIELKIDDQIMNKTKKFKSAKNSNEDLTDSVETLSKIQSSPLKHEMISCESNSNNTKQPSISINMPLVDCQKDLNDKFFYENIVIPDLPIERFYDLGQQFKLDINTQRGKVQKWVMTLKSALHYSMCAYKLELCESPKAYRVYKETLNMFVSLVMGISGSNRQDKLKEAILSSLSYLIKSTLSLRIYKMKRKKLLDMQKKIDTFLKSNKNFDYPGNFSMNNKSYATNSSSGINSDTSPSDPCCINQETLCNQQDCTCCLDSANSLRNYTIESSSIGVSKLPTKKKSIATIDNYDNQYNGTNASSTLQCSSYSKQTQVASKNLYNTNHLVSKTLNDITLPMDIYNSIYNVNYVQYFLGQAFDWWEKFEVTKLNLNKNFSNILKQKPNNEQRLEIAIYQKILAQISLMDFHSTSIIGIFKITTMTTDLLVNKIDNQ